MSTLGWGAAGAQAQRAGAALGMALGGCLARGSMLLLWRAGALQGVALGGCALVLGAGASALAACTFETSMSSVARIC